VVGQDAIAVTDIVSVDLLYGPGNLFVDLLSLLRKDGIIDHFSGEGVFEDVGAVGIDAPLIEKLRIPECG
jgi:hypothetical protein